MYFPLKYTVTAVSSYTRLELWLPIICNSSYNVLSTFSCYVKLLIHSIYSYLRDLFAVDLSKISNKIDCKGLGNTQEGNRKHFGHRNR